MRLTTLLGKRGLYGLVLCGLFTVNMAIAANTEHPKLVLTSGDVSVIQAEIDSVPSFAASLSDLKANVDKTMAQAIDVPIPKDAGGGYTHEQHKRNNNTIYGAGVLYQLTAEKKYFEHARKLLLAYAELYPSLGDHPKKKEQSPGRLFWQSLNEAVWLVYSIQGYDAIINDLSEQDREIIEGKLLRPMTQWMSEGSPQTFDKIHNHGTWAVAAVGMTGYVLNDQELVEKSLLGLDKSGDAGFLKQIDDLFSPDGYYTEGPYYQRYALMPFVLFAKAIENNEPQRKIFEYREGLLVKAIYAAVQLSYNKLFFPINDALKDKSIATTELVHGVSIAYGITNDPALLDIANVQGRVSVSGDGFKMAKGIDRQLTKPFPYKSMHFRDGADGKQGALTVFRSGMESGHQALVLKNTSQGMGHGHFDKLNWLFYDNGQEIVSDYGAARFLNIESKYGGHYLPENNLYAKQTIAHNTLVVDETSHFNGKWRESQKHAPSIAFVEHKESHSITSASVSAAYEDVFFTRTMAMLNHHALQQPIVVDLLETQSKLLHQYDLPLHFKGHITDHTLLLSANTAKRKPLGKKNGYQFLWNEALGQPGDALPQVTWINDGRFYTASFAKTNFTGFDNTNKLRKSAKSHSKQGLAFTRIGANDPNFNLRPEQAIIQRVSSGSHAFLSILEPHGEYNPTLEYTTDSASNISDVRIEYVDAVKLVLMELRTGQRFGLAIASSGDLDTTHSFVYDGKDVVWKGHSTVFDL